MGRDLAKILMFARRLAPAFAALMLGLILPALFLDLGGTPVWAHGAEIKAFVTLDPPVPVVGQHRIRVELLDFYDNPVPGAQLRAGVGGQPGSVPLQEIDLGVHQGTISLPDGGRASLGLTATLPDGPWAGQGRLAIGPGSSGIQRTLLALRHRDERLLSPAGMALLGIIAVAVLLRVVFGGGFVPEEDRR